MTSDLRIKTAAQLTGADGVFFRLVEVTMRRLIAAKERAPDTPDALSASDAERVQQSLILLYPEFQRFYLRLFVKHVGLDHAAAVLRELQEKPLRHYVRTRDAMAAELLRAQQQLSSRLRATCDHPPCQRERS